MRLIDLFENLYRPLRLRGRSPATARLYGCTIRAFGKWLGREPELRDLDELPPIFRPSCDDEDNDAAAAAVPA